MASKTVIVSAGDDLFRVAARLYRDATAATLLLRANGLTDFVVQKDLVLIVPTYNRNRANDGIMASQ